MIERNHRFHGYSSLKYVYKHGQTVRGPLLSLRFIQNEHRQTWRLAVVVSRKVSKSAVERNRIRRRIYELMRQQEALITNPLDLLIVVFSPSIGELEPAKLSDTISELLVKAGRNANRSSSKSDNQRAIVNSKED